MPETAPQALERLSVVVLTHNRADELRRTLEQMLALPRPPALTVIDNASRDWTVPMLRRAFPQVKVIALQRNMGAAARNIGVQVATTPYVAFCDDDTWWAPGSLERAVELLDRHPQAAVLSARVLVGAEQREDPTCAAMANSPLPNDGLPGPALLGFLAGACVVRKSAFLQAGGYEPRFFIGGEEALLALDLLARGWRIAYVPQLTVHHHPSSQRDSGGRKTLLARNALWLAWMRLPPALAFRESARILRAAHRDNGLRHCLPGALRGLVWALRRRAVIAPQLAEWYRKLREQAG